MRHHEANREFVFGKGEPARAQDLLEARYLIQRYDDVEIVMWAGLKAEQRVDTPATVEPHLDSGGPQEMVELEDGFGGHDTRASGVLQAARRRQARSGRDALEPVLGDTGIHLLFTRSDEVLAVVLGSTVAVRVPRPRLRRSADDR
jgi:hypothetical protein